MEFTATQIAALVHGTVKGDGNARFSRLSKIQEAKRGDVTFFSNPKYENYLYTTQAGAVIINKSYVLKQEISPVLILAEDPYSAFTLLIDEYCRIINFEKEGVEEPCYLGKDSAVGSHVKIGDHVKIYPQVFIGDNVIIGNNVILYPQVKVYRNTRIGNDCVLHAGAVLGSDGFGFAPQPDGTFKTIPQLGNVVLEDQVSIGANTVI